MRKIQLSVLLTLLCSGAAVADNAASVAPAPIVKEVMTQPLPDFPGKEALMLLVEYPPGGADPVHRHNADAFVYVLEGSVVMGVAGREPVTLKAGQTFHEAPEDVHTIGRNASNDKPAKFVVLLLKDIGKPALLPVD